jgi:hypothetical protein
MSLISEAKLAGHVLDSEGHPVPGAGEIHGADCGPGGQAAALSPASSWYTHGMSKRLQVVMPEGELRSYERLARAEGISLSDWVRRALRQARLPPRAAPEKRLTAIRLAAKHSFPSGDIDDMLVEIERGYVGGLPE